MNCRLFIADDSEVLCSLLVEKFHEYENLDIVGLAHNYSDAIKSISLAKPDVTILDIQMPGGSGINILSYIKRYQSSNKVIVFTNYPYPQYRKKCMDAGADYFFDKYSEFNDFFKVVKKLVEEHCQPESSETCKSDVTEIKKNKHIF